MSSFTKADLQSQKEKNKNLLKQREIKINQLKQKKIELEKINQLNNALIKINNAEFQDISFDYNKPQFSLTSSSSSSSKRSLSFSYSNPSNTINSFSRSTLSVSSNNNNNTKNNNDHNNSSSSLNKYSKGSRPSDNLINLHFKKSFIPNNFNGSLLRSSSLSSSTDLHNPSPININNDTNINLKKLNSRPISNDSITSSESGNFIFDSQLTSNSTSNSNSRLSSLTSIDSQNILPFQFDNQKSISQDVNPIPNFNNYLNNIISKNINSNNNDSPYDDYDNININSNFNSNTYNQNNTSNTPFPDYHPNPNPSHNTHVRADSVATENTVLSNISENTLVRVNSNNTNTSTTTIASNNTLSQLNQNNIPTATTTTTTTTNNFDSTKLENNSLKRIAKPSLKLGNLSNLKHPNFSEAELEKHTRINTHINSKLIPIKNSNSPYNSNFSPSDQNNFKRFQSMPSLQNVIKNKNDPIPSNPEFDLNSQNNQNNSHISNPHHNDYYQNTLFFDSQDSHNILNVYKNSNAFAQSIGLDLSRKLSQSKYRNELPTSSFNPSQNLVPYPPDSNLTPGQKYQLKRQMSQSKLLKSNNHQNDVIINTNDELLSDDDPLLYNIPFASGSAATLFTKQNGKSEKFMKHVLNDSPSALPPSPLVEPTLNSPDLQFANALSAYYKSCSDNYIKKEMKKREENSLRLPSFILNQAEVESLSSCSSMSSKTSRDSKLSIFSSSSNSSLTSTEKIHLEDLKLISAEKTEVLSQTRPMWLPPKLQQEKQKHDEELQNLIFSLQKKELKRNSLQQKKIELDQKNAQKWFELSVKVKEVHKNSIYEMSKLCWKTNIPQKLRFKIWFDILTYYNKKNGLSEEIESLTLLSNKLKTIDISYKEIEIDLIIEKLYPHLDKFQKGCPLYDSIKNLLLCKSISRNGLNFGDEILSAILLLNFTKQETFTLINLLDKNVLNDVFVEKFDKNIKTNPALKKYLSKFFDDELSNLNTRVLFKMLLKINNQLMIQILDHLILNNNYKVFYCMFLVVIKFYHFGFLDISDLIKNEDKQVNIPNDNDFLEKFAHYYKKF
ncbi:uncharacterized protein ASCRUDRAFT_129829 [Ascoidea rubescens DSM 1968]|uniref:Rab-GAP TBC domain-containing protein n=1 Tax=Ascoidea rubescens DSM 1968 TaxID=1344418 RepID=A0A1D2V9I2_9ASCO|nr:hypothetical protein ASCRUDRAFT_129829 [Ascoidea rubescens DSM 1968]ODV58113.1 hypothetical protein ASCRUDRAFT_129829 [Ascoidea rubescens DSM 1968]